MNYLLNEIFDVEELKNICESFTDLTGILTAIIDLEGEVHIATGWQPICTQFHRTNNCTNKRCIESDTRLSNQLGENNRYSIYKCKNGLIDVAMPIMVGKTHVANFFTGQFLTEKPDVEYFKKQAKEFGFDEQKYMAALDKVPIYTEEYVKKSIYFLVQLAETIANIGVKNLESLEINRQLESEKNKLISAEEQKKDILSAVRNGLVFIDKNFNIQWVNEAAEELSGIEAEKLINKICHKIFHNRNTPCEGCPLIETLKTGERTQGEVSISGNRIIHIAGEPVKNSKGKLIGAIENFTDITERKVAENKHKEIENKMSSIFRAAPTGIGVVKNRIITEINPRLSEITGYSKKELIGESSIVLYPTKEDYEYVGEEKYRQINEKGTGTVETLWQKKDGTIINILLSSTPINTENHSDGITFTALDITERKKAEEALRISERHNRTWIENSPICTKIVDLDFNLQFISSSGIKDLKIKDISEFYGKPYPFQFYPNSFKISMTNNLNKVKETGEIITQEASVLDIEGNVLWYQFTIVPVYDEKGKLDYILIVSLEITKRKKAEDALKESESRYRLLASNTLDAIWTTDVAFNITYVNKAIGDFLGYTQEELLNLNPDKFTTPQGLQIIQKNAEQLLINYKKGIINQAKFELQQIKKDGTIIDVEISANILLDTNGEFIGFQGRSNDITKRKKTEENLIIAKNKAQESDRLKSAFLSNMSHEIRTPLNGIIGFIDFVIDPDYDIEEKKEFVKIINKSSYRLINTVSDIIDISKIEAGQMDLSLKEVCVNDILEELYSLFNSEAESKKLTLISSPTLSNNEATIITDNHKLYGIISNLIKNAIKYTDEGSIRFGYILKGDVLEFYVKDTGIGVPKNRQQAIFNRFEQADITDTRAFEGSGLGLAIAKAYSLMLNGKLWMTSKEGEGSEFKFTIPYKAGTSLNHKPEII